VNQQYLKSKYKFKEGAPLKEYLQSRVTSFREPCTLVEVLTWLKDIIRDNLLFDERNPAVIVGDAPLEAALRNKKVHVNDIRSVVMQQLMMVESRQGPWNQSLLLRGMARLESMSTSSRPEEQATATPVSVPRARATDASRGHRDTQPGLWNFPRCRHGGSSEVTQAGQSNSRAATGDWRCFLHISCTARCRTEWRGSDHGKCSHWRRVYGGKITSDDP
jgi:hypothetical protein